MMFATITDLSSGQTVDGGGGTAVDPSSLLFFSRTISETADIFQRTLRDNDNHHNPFVCVRSID